jgi:beta-lactam-binding protein with PASTA domain
MIRTAHLAALAATMSVLLGVAAVCTSQPGEVKVPDVIGLRPEVAERRLRGAGLGEVSFRDSLSESEPGFIIRQDPPAGQPVAEGDRVRLWVARSPEPGEERVVVPRVLEHRLDEADGILAEAGLHVGEVTEIRSPAEESLVLGQRPAPGRVVRRGTAVDIDVSVGEGPLGSVPVPNVLGRNLEEAEHMIARAKLETGDVSGDGVRVVRQNPRPGMMVPAGTGVDLVLGAEERAKIPWLPIIGGLVLVLIAVSYTMWRLGRAGGMELKPVKGTRGQEMISPKHNLSGPEACLKVIRDPGSQEISAQSALTGDERRKYG